MIYVWTNVSRSRSSLRDSLKDAGTSNIASLTVLWRIFDFFVMKKWFHCTDAVKDDTRIGMSSFGIPSRNLSLTSERVSNVDHWSQFPG